MHKLMIMAGGTGGHIFPGLAVAALLDNKGWTVEWLGTADKMEAQIVPQHGIPLHTIEVKGVRGNGIIRLLSLPFMLIKAIFQAYKILRAVRPDVVLGMGGYASGPGGIAAKLMGIPLVLHEQNAVAGMTNRYLAKIAQRVLTGFPNTNMGKQKSDMTWVGNPVRAEISAVATKTKSACDVNASITILVVGGSLGAQVFNTQLPSMFANLAVQLDPKDTKKTNLNNPKLQIIHQVGRGNQAAVTDAYITANISPLVQLTVTDFIDDMAAVFAQADIIVCRAGALTVAEVACAGKVGCFVPLPSAVDDHQTANAQSLSDHGGAILCPQSRLVELEEKLIHLIMTPKDRQNMARQALQLAKPDATEKVCSIIEEIAA